MKEKKDFIMQMLAIEIEDSFFQEFLKIIEPYKDKIQNGEKVPGFDF